MSTAATDADPATHPALPRFLTLDQVAGELNVSWAQVYALVRDRSLTAVKIGGRGQWRVECCKLEDYIAQLYVQADGAAGIEVFDENQA